MDVVCEYFLFYSCALDCQEVMRMLIVLAAFFIFMPMHAFHFYFFVLFGRITLLLSWGNDP